MEPTTQIPQVGSAQGGSGKLSFRRWLSSLSRMEKILFVILAVVFLAIFYITLDANKYRAQVHVIEGRGRVGVNPTTERLDFGDLSPGTQTVRRVDIQNRTAIPLYVAVVRFGSVSELMKLDKNFFILPANAQTKIEFSVYMPASARIGETMTGRVFLFKIPGPWQGDDTYRRGLAPDGSVL